MQTPDAPARLVRPLATGATFQVDLVEIAGRTAVEKRVTAALAGAPEATEMLVREAAFLEAVRLPFLPRIIACHAADGASPLRVHETFVAGDHLDVALAHERHVEVRAAILVALVQVIAALHAATDGPGVAAGAFHGDLSPSNVLCDRGEIGLVDFGASGTRTLPALPTRGTLPHASPEVLRGDASVDQASDRYALAIMTIEALTPGLAPAGDAGTRLRDLPEAARILIIGDRGLAPLPPDDERMRPIARLLADMIAFREADRPRDLDALRDALFSLATRP